MSTRIIVLALGAAAVAVCGFWDDKSAPFPKPPAVAPQTLLQLPPPQRITPEPVAIAVAETVPLPRPRPSPAPRAEKQAEVVLTAAAIAAIIVRASRETYYATGRPCACPNDSMRNGKSCGSRSAYSRPGGAQPLCYAADVSPTMIEAYRLRTAAGSPTQARR